MIVMSNRIPIAEVQVVLYVLGIQQSRCVNKSNPKVKIIRNNHSRKERTCNGCFIGDKR